MTDIDKQLRDLETARKRVEEIAMKRSRLVGQLDLEKNNLARLEKESMERFETSVEELPDLAEGLESDAEKSLAKAKKILGME